MILKQETNLAFVSLAQNANSTSALIVTSIFMRACIIAPVVRASGIRSLPLLMKNDGSCDFIISLPLVPEKVVFKYWFSSQKFFSPPSHTDNKFIQITSPFGHAHMALILTFEEGNALMLVR